MHGFFEAMLTRFAGKRPSPPRRGPLLLELWQDPEGEELESYRTPPFRYTLKQVREGRTYGVSAEVSSRELLMLRDAVSEMSESFRISEVRPLTFERLVEVLCQTGAGCLAQVGDVSRVRELTRLAAFEAVGIPTVYALAMDPRVTEFYVDATSSPVYLDHTKYGRCDSGLVLTERERRAVETHMDTFKGYTADYSNPSLKNEFDIFGHRLRVSLDLAPLAVNGFSLDVRKLTSNDLTLLDLVRMGVLSSECAAFLLAALEVGMNVTIVGETGTGKTTLLNALDEAMDPRLRRVYVEDAVETKDLLARGYHQLKLRVDPFEHGSDGARTKSEEVTKVLHRSPDIVVLGEIQSEEHSRAFFHALTAGVRGIQTFHASSPSQAVRRWREIHGVSRTSLLDLDVIVQMSRPERLAAGRRVQSVSMLVEENGDPRLRDIYARGYDGELRRISPWERVQFRTPATTPEIFAERLERLMEPLRAQLPRVGR